jgi:hypothetical protein
LIAQAVVFLLFFTTGIGYLWYNAIGCGAVVILAPALQWLIFRAEPMEAA